MVNVPAGMGSIFRPIELVLDSAAGAAEIPIHDSEINHKRCFM